MRTLLAATALIALAPLAAHAEDRMSDARYLHAEECLAYVDIPALAGDGVNVTTLREETEASARRRVPGVHALLESQNDSIRRAGYRHSRSERGLQQLRDRREDACASFVRQGWVSMDANAARS